MDIWSWLGSAKLFRYSFISSHTLEFIKILREEIYLLQVIVLFSG